MYIMATTGTQNIHSAPRPPSPAFFTFFYSRLTLVLFPSFATLMLLSILMNPERSSHITVTGPSIEYGNLSYNIQIVQSSRKHTKKTTIKRRSSLLINEVESCQCSRYLKTKPPNYPQQRIPPIMTSPSQGQWGLTVEQAASRLVHIHGSPWLSCKTQDR